MPRRSRLAILLDETFDILVAVGIPFEGLTLRRRVKLAKAFLSVAGMKPGMAWSEARADHRLRSRDVIRWMNEYLDEQVSPGSYDDIRRKDLLLPVEAGIVLKSASNESAATNDGTRTYALSGEMATLLNSYGTTEWESSLASFLAGRVKLAEQLMKTRLHMRIPVTIGTEQIYFGPGEHNLLQKAIIEDFLARFGHTA